MTADTGNGGPARRDTADELAILRALTASHSCRSFAPSSVPRDLVASVIDAARWAGSARNAQPWRFAAVTCPRTQEALSRLGAYAQHLAGAPLVLAILEPVPGTRDTQFDLGRVTQNIALAAQARGLGSCVATFYPEANAVTAASVTGAGPGWTARHALAIGWPVPRPGPGAARAAPRYPAAACRSASSCAGATNRKSRR